MKHMEKIDIMQLALFGAEVLHILQEDGVWTGDTARQIGSRARDMGLDNQRPLFAAADGVAEFLDAARTDRETGSADVLVAFKNGVLWSFDDYAEAGCPMASEDEFGDEALGVIYENGERLIMAGYPNVVVRVSGLDFPLRGKPADPVVVKYQGE